MIRGQSSLRADLVVWLSHTTSVWPWSGMPKVRMYGAFISGLWHIDMTGVKDPRSLTNTRWDLFPNLKLTSRPTLWTGIIQMPSEPNWSLLRSRRYGNLGIPVRPLGLDQPDVTAGELLPWPRPWVHPRVAQVSTQWKTLPLRATSLLMTRVGEGTVRVLS